MSESDNTKELDNYGVWVKKPPRTVSSDETLPDEIAPSGTEIKNAGTGDNKMEDIDIDSFMDGADFSSSPSADSEPEKKAASADGTEEVSLDEFLDGGVFESDDGGSAASEKSELESKSSSQPESQQSQALPDSGFSVPEDIAATDSSQASTDDSTLDIDLSFDDEPAASSQNSSEPQFETIDVPPSSSSGLTSNSSSPSNDGTENIDLSEFGFDIDAPESPADEKPPVSETQAEEKPENHKVDENGMEEVSLDDFDFDINAEEGPSGDTETPQKTEEPKLETEVSAEAKTAGEDDIELDTSAKNPVEDSDLDSLSLDGSPDAAPSLELPETDEAENNVSDGDMETANEADSDKNFKADGDDFDLESIMNSIEDENGEKVSLDAKDNVVKNTGAAPAAEPKTEPENTDNLNLDTATADEIPDSFDEETASLFADEEKDEDDSDKTLVEPESAPQDIVEQSEPVFEETSVDLSELPEEIPENGPETESKESGTQEASNSGDNMEKTSNPFTLPPDDAFVSSNEAPAEKTNTENENSADETIAAATAGKDEEIASSTNSILSQIVSELASLKSEISGLKNEFDELKSKKSSVQENPVKNTEEENTGFFSGNEDDDTIALSVDELDNILNSAEMVNEGDKEDSQAKKIENPEKLENEPSELEENISDSSDDLLPDYTDDDAEENQKDIFIPKAEEIEEAQSLIDFGKTDGTEDSGLAPNSVEKDSSDDAQTQSDDEFSIGDFSFDDDNENSEAADEIQPGQEIQDETVLPVESSNSLFSDNSTAGSAPYSNEKTESTVDEPFEFGLTSNSNEEFKEPVPQEEENSVEPAAENDSISISNEELNNLLAPDPTIEESLTDENLNYLAADKGIDENETEDTSSIPGNLKKEIKSVLSYMDQLLENLPEDKIAEFAQSEQFETYKKLFKELGLDKQQA